jgi:tetratricopeptide (TPR) repeat protein
MKSSIVVSIALGVAVTGGAILYHRHSASSSVPATPATAAPATPPVETPPPAPAPVETKPAGPESATAVAPVANEARPEAATPVTHLSRALGALLSAQTSFQERQALWKQLRESGELDNTIAALKTGMTEHPDDPTYPTALGEAEISKIREIKENNGDYNSIAILALQADQHFDAALKLDPANWEAQYSQAASLAYWPAEMNKGPAVIQRLSGLIDQQETMSPQPQFALTYLLLGEQYQKSGQPDYAEQTWKLGAARFPDNAALRKKISGAR